MPQHIIFQVALMAFNCVQGHEPDYLNNILVPVQSVRAHAWVWPADYSDVILPDRPSEPRDTDISRLQFVASLKRVYS